MAERYRYHPRPHSPTFNPARVSLPSNLAGFGHPAAHEHHLHVVPTSRRETPSSHTRSGSGTSSNAGTVTTTYKIKAEPPPRSNSAQANHSSQSRRRSSTIDNHIRPTVVTTVSRPHKPVIHSASGRPASPMKNHYRSSEEDYYTIPANSQHGHSHHKRYSGGMDSADLGRSSAGNTLKVGSSRQEAKYHSSRPRSTYPVPVARQTEPVAGDYGDDGYGYTNPRDLVQYDLNQPARHHHQRSTSIDRNRTARPNSISGYGDVVPRAYETRERGPPPTTRGFDRIPRGATWEAPATARMPPPPTMELIQRPARVDSFDAEPASRNGSTRPVSLYHDRDRERRRNSREDYYEHRDSEPRHRRDSSYRSEKPRFVENPVEQRGFGIRTEAPPPRQPSRSDMVERVDRAEYAPERNDRPGRVERAERTERLDRQERSDWVDRGDRNDRSDRRDRPDRPDDDRDRDHKSSRDVLTAGLGIAGAALGLKSIKNAREDREERDRDSDGRDEREERKRREYDDEPRRRRETRDDRSSPESGARDSKERRRRDDDREWAPPQPPRDMPPAPKNNSLPSRDVPSPVGDVPPKDIRERNSDPSVFLDLAGRNPQERPSSRNDRVASRHEARNDRDSDSDKRERRRPRNEEPPSSSGSHSDSPDTGSGGFHHSRPAISKENAVAPAAFNPKDTMDLKALKEALNSKENSMPKEALPTTSSRAPRVSATKTSTEAAQIRSDLEDDRRSREPLIATDNLSPRVVSPPRPKGEVKSAVKGILRAPKEKFPEDPSPIREGVAPLKDAKKDGVPPDARWTKISRKLVNPEALELGKERFEARDDFVIVLRVLSRDEVQGYAEVTQKLRAAREDAEEQAGRDERRRARRERHERHKRERSRGERTERSDRRRRDKEREREVKESESDTTEDDERDDGPKLLEPAPPRRRTGSNNFQDAMMGGGLHGPPPMENPDIPGQYLNYTRNPPSSSSLVAQSAGSTRRDRE